jgi:RHS repeat-associated protein
MAMVDSPSGDFYFYLNDHLGSPQYMTNEAGVVVWEARYLPFGQAIINGHSSVENNFRFPGQYYDSETGLHYNYHRHYDPKTGRYITADPSHSIEPKATNIPYLVPFLLASPQELNVYHYTFRPPDIGL